MEKENVKFFLHQRPNFLLKGKKVKTKSSSEQFKSSENELSRCLVQIRFDRLQ